MIQLSNIAPDFESIVAQLQTEADNFPTWKDRITGATGQTIIEMIAAIAAYSQFAIESSYQETFPDSAKNADSLYAAANYAGVRITRKNPAALSFQMTSTTSITLPSYTQFVGAGTKWFNRDALVLSPTPTTVTLYQGEIVKKSVYGLGTDFQAFVSAEKDFTVSDTDVLVTINGVSIPTITQGLWTKKGVPGCQQLTRPDGSMLLLFGSDLYGSKPGINDLAELTYVVTLGEDGNNIVTTDKQIVMDGNTNINGVPATGPNGGGNQPDYVQYKNVTPALFGAFDSAVTATQYKALPLQYPGVIDARVLAQREINPRALTWMNVMKVSLLTTGGVWDSAQWNNFEQWFNASTMYSTRISRSDPQPINITVTATVSCKTFANLTAVKAKIEAALDELFELRQGSIGLDIYMSDVITAIKEADSNVEFVQLVSPNFDIALSTLGVETPTLIEQFGGGSLPIGTYDYGINVTSTLGGSSAPAKWATITTTSPGSSIRIEWPQVPNGANYGVWGRITGPDLGAIATVGPSSAPFYIDTGAVVPTPPVPVESTISAYYPQLVAKNITMQYTNRNLRS